MRFIRRLFNKKVMPSYAKITGYKKVYIKKLNTKSVYTDDRRYYYEPIVAVLEIPRGEKRFQELRWRKRDGWKCRAASAKVLRFETYEGLQIDGVEVVSGHDKNFVYKAGEIVRPRGKFFAPADFGTCASGIHFFMRREDAIGY